ncbi:SIR2 family protein [Pedobacter hiemivivus]|uniref:Tetratricopeptide repeat protein n=1 Tax=Pedobacter hiemivivus TaxID=2530454 RepID=A0A4R0NDH5_9SPHI|nr:SIR2 family protein [Pedobacter hiemivivus]TCC97132.1 hypothetical protein EZ444_09775 [Pedobacter hiemivivus]
MQKELEELLISTANNLKRKQAAIFCGAGISFHSGLPLANEMINYILKSCDLEENAREKIMSSSLPFEAIIEAISIETGIDEMLDIFGKGEPNVNHKWIALMAKQGFVNNIFTTNFDLHIENELTKHGLVNEVDYQVFSNECDFNKLNWQNEKISLIKIHGCISNKKDLGITMRSVANKTNSLNKRKLISDFFTKSINSKVIITGYSCSDHFDISPEIERLDKEKSEVLFIDHSFGAAFLENIKLKVNNNPFKSFNQSVRLKIDTDIFIKELWNLSSDVPYEFTKHPKTLWHIDIDNWLTRVYNENTTGFKYSITSRLLYAIGEFTLSLIQNEKAINVATSLRNSFALSAEIGNKAMALNQLARHPEAIKCLETSIRMCKEIGNIHGEITQLHVLGNIHKNLYDFEPAILNFQRALFLAEKEQMEVSISSILGDLGAVYYLQKDHHQAISILNKGLSISLKIGNKQFEASQLMHLGLSYIDLGNKSIGVSYLNESYEINKLIGHKSGQSIIKVNLGRMHFYEKNFDHAIQEATVALNLAKECETPHIQALCYCVIGECYLRMRMKTLAIDNLANSYEIYKVNHNPNIVHVLEKIIEAKNL